MKPKTIRELTPLQLKRLKKDCIINSFFLRDYTNRYGVDPSEACDFFMGYLDYLEELMREDTPQYEDDWFWTLFDKYDTQKNLVNWWFYWIN